MTYRESYATKHIYENSACYMQRTYHLYIMSNKPNGTLYIGVTNYLLRRVLEHKNEILKGFTYKYKLDKLVYAEEFTSIESAIKREKQLKNWHREWKINLIESLNPTWDDLFESI